MRLLVIFALLLGLVGNAWGEGEGAAPPAEDEPEPESSSATESTGFIGKRKVALEIDDCPLQPNLSKDKQMAVAREHYTRGEVLYVQGDYAGSVKELTASYCLFPYYTILKDIGQAYERQLDFQKAIAYLERFVAAVPLDAKRANECAVEPEDDKRNVTARILVLSALPARIKVATNPPGAAVVLQSDTGIVARGVANGALIETRAGRYQMTISAPGYETVTQDVEFEVGKPYGYFFGLSQQRGRLFVTSVPDTAAISLGGKSIGVGAATTEISAGKYVVTASAPGYKAWEQAVEILPQQSQRVTARLTEIPRNGRTELLIGATVGASIFGATLGGGTDYVVPFVIGGAVVGAGVAQLAMPNHIPLGTATLTNTSMLGGTLAAVMASSWLGASDRTSSISTSLSIATSAGVGYWLGSKYKVTAGDSALINSGVIWGSTIGAFFGQSFSGSPQLQSGLTLAGLGVGTLSAALITRSISYSRKHIALIDLGGVVGMAGGLAFRSLRSDQISDASRSHNALGGLVIGLVTATVLTRNLDEPAIPKLRGTVGSAPDSEGKAITTFGITGDF